MLSRPALRAALALPVCAALIALGPGSAFSDDFLCDVDKVAVFTKASGGARIHAHCASPAPGGISYFALDLKKSKLEAPMLIELLSTAVAFDHSVYVFYDPDDLSGAKIGCATGDCRLMHGAELAQ